MIIVFNSVVSDGRYLYTFNTSPARRYSLLSMFNFTFSFAAALWALPLAGIPIVLHLLFKQKSPVVQFSTLRFVKMSIQQTAARKRVQKWLLLACRALLVALLIWAIAQPVHQLTSSWLTAGGRSVAAAVVVDTSYSMQLQDGQLTLLNKADSTVQELLRDQLAGAKVAVFTSQPADADHPEQLQDASALLTQWSPLKPTASLKPLSARVAAAVDLLNRQPADQKWLVVISDFQSKEFPQEMPGVKDGRTVLLDLHATPRSDGITRITLNPAQPIPGIPLEANVEVTGQPGDSRPLKLSVNSIGGNQISQYSPEMVQLDSSGRANRQFPLRLPAERWLLIAANLTDDDAMQWDNQRTLLVEVPPKQRVGVIQQTLGSISERVLTLALDPSEGHLAEWPLSVVRMGMPTPAEDVVVAALTHWPDSRQAAALHRFAKSGRTVILFLAPGLERSWPNLSTQTQDDLAALLPSAPLQRPGSFTSRAAVADARDPLLAGLTDEKYQLNAIVVRQMVPLAATGDSSTILNAVPADPVPGSRTMGLLFRKPVGSGVCFTWATLPDSQYTNLATHPTFLPLLVRMALKPPEQSAGQNVELGQPLVLDAAKFPDQHELQIEGPQHEIYRVKAVETDDARQFVFDQANEPGIYQWKTINNPAPVAMTNVQLPAGESDLTYRPPDSIAPAGGETIIATSVSDLTTKMAALTAPQPQWSVPLAIVMFLLCLEALMGSWSKVWKPISLRGFVPGLKTETG